MCTPSELRSEEGLPERCGYDSVFSWSWSQEESGQCATGNGSLAVAGRAGEWYSFEAASSYHEFRLTAEGDPAAQTFSISTDMFDGEGERVFGSPTLIETSFGAMLGFNSSGRGPFFIRAFSSGTHTVEIVAPPLAYTVEEMQAVPSPATEQATVISARAIMEVSLPFSFSFFGLTYDRAWLSSSGYLTFEEPPSAHSFARPRTALVFCDGSFALEEAGAVVTQESLPGSDSANIDGVRFRLRAHLFDAPRASDVSVTLRKNGSVEISWDELDLSNGGSLEYGLLSYIAIADGLNKTGVGRVADASGNGNGVTVVQAAAERGGSVTPLLIGSSRYFAKAPGGQTATEGLPPVSPSVSCGENLVDSGALCVCGTGQQCGAHLCRFMDDEQLCVWHLQCSSGTAQLHFTSFQTEGGYDYLTLYDGSSVGAASMLHASGDSLPHDAVASGPAMTVEHTTDENTLGAGWSAEFTCSVSGAEAAATDQMVYYTRDGEALAGKPEERTSDEILLFRQTANWDTSAPALPTLEQWLNWNSNDPTDDNYSILNQLDDSMRGPDGKFLLRLSWPHGGYEDSILWKQTSNPLIGGTSSSDPTQADGFEAIDVPFPGGKRRVTDGSVDCTFGGLAPAGDTVDPPAVLASCVGATSSAPWYEVGSTAMTYHEVAGLMGPVRGFESCGTFFGESFQGACVATQVELHVVVNSSLAAPEFEGIVCRAGRCATQSKTLGARTFVLVTRELGATFGEAREHCRAEYGGDLASIHNANELDWVRSLCSRANATHERLHAQNSSGRRALQDLNGSALKTSCFIGLTAGAHGGPFAFSDGSATDHVQSLQTGQAGWLAVAGSQSTGWDSQHIDDRATTFICADKSYHGLKATGDAHLQLPGMTLGGALTVSAWHKGLVTESRSLFQSFKSQSCGDSDECRNTAGGYILIGGTANSHSSTSDLLIAGVTFERSTSSDFFEHKSWRLLTVVFVERAVHVYSGSELVGTGVLEAAVPRFFREENWLMSAVGTPFQPTRGELALAEFRLYDRSISSLEAAALDRSAFGKCRHRKPLSFSFNSRAASTHRQSLNAPVCARLTVGTGQASAVLARG